MNKTPLAYRSDIDGLRAFAVLAVIGYHYFPRWVRGGFVGVDVFFVISGFLIGGILLDALAAGKFSLLDFYMRRIRRIVPALLLVMVAALAFGWFALLPDDYQSLGKHTAGGASFISNLLLWKEAGYFDVISERKPLLHLWSLGVEEQFYIVFPILLWLTWRSKLRCSACIFVLLIASLALNLAVCKKYAVFDFYAPLTRFWELLVGSGIAAIERSNMPVFSRGFLKCDAWLAKIFPNGSALENEGRSLRNCLSILGSLLLLTAIFTTSIQHFPGSKALLPVLGAVCVVVAGGEAWGNRCLLSWRPMVLIGLISYPLYLWHWPLLSYARIILGEMPDRGFRIGLLVLALGLATLTYLLIERPTRFGARAKGLKAAVLLALLLALGGVGGMVYLKAGLSERAAVVEVADFIKEIGSVRTLFQDEDCKKRYGFENSPETDYCLYRDVKGEATVAIIGDSHAIYAFESVAAYNARRGVNTVGLGRSGEGNPANGKIAETKYLQKVFSALRTDSKIHKVFIITRGMMYLSGMDYVEGEYARISAKEFKNKTQATVDRLSAAGKAVYIVAENPELPVNIRDSFPLQPLRPRRERLRLSKADVLARQQEYLDVLKSISGAKIIDTVDIFCPTEECLLVNARGLPLYYDDDHLSIHAGGEFLVDYVLKPYL